VMLPQMLGSFSRFAINCLSTTINSANKRFSRDGFPNGYNFIPFRWRYDCIWIRNIQIFAFKIIAGVYVSKT
jgi:hypothetical protein